MVEFSYDEESFVGCSRGSIETCISMPRFDLVFDIGKANQEHINMQRLLLSHGHLDHSAGLIYYISQRNLRNLATPDIYVPEAILKSIQIILKEYTKIEQYQMRYHLHKSPIDEDIHLTNDYYFTAIKTLHRVPSCAYMIVRKVLKLREHCYNLKPKQIQMIKNKPNSKEYMQTFYQKRIPYVTYSGDTKIEFLTQNSEVQQSKILFLECTFINDKRSVEQTRYWGHIHLDEICQHAELLSNIKQLYLIHFSPRYDNNVIRQTLKRSLPKWLYDKVQALPLIEMQKKQKS